MADQFDLLDTLLDPEDQMGDPLRRKATSAALRRQNALGVVGQLMNLAPTKAVGTSLQEQSQTGLRQAMAKTQAAREAAQRKAEQDAAQKRWEQEQAESKRQFGANYGLKQQELGIAQAKAAREAQGGDWKVRVDMTGNPVGWYNDRGDFVTLDGQRFSVNADNLGGGAPRGAPMASPAAFQAGGPAMPAAGPAGRGGEGRVQPQPSPFGLPPTSGTPQAFGGPQPSPGAAPTVRGAQPTGIDESRAASLRLGRLKSLPAEQQNKYGTAIAQRNRLPSLIQDIESNPQAFGLTRDIAQHIPGQPGTAGAVVQGIVRSTQDKYRDPKEAEVRSRVYQEAYEVIHALAGAALSTGEANRILGFMPGPTDPPEKILANLRSAYEEANRTINTLEAMAGVPEQIRSPRESLPPSRPKSQPRQGEEEIIDLPPRNR